MMEARVIAPIFFRCNIVQVQLTLEFPSNLLWHLERAVCYNDKGMAKANPFHKPVNIDNRRPRTMDDSTFHVPFVKAPHGVRTQALTAPTNLTPPPTWANDI
jgi:hypothetical protein